MIHSILFACEENSDECGDQDYSDPETAILGVAFHAFEWLFVRVAPVILIAALIGIFFTRKKD